MGTHPRRRGERHAVGKLTREAWETIRDRIVSRAREAAAISGAVLALHGAMVTETEDDAEGALLEALRGALGPALPIIVTLDLHANATPRMAKHANALISYRTYPHVDQYERAQQAAALLDRIATGRDQVAVRARPAADVARRRITGARCSPARCATCSRWPSASRTKKAFMSSASRRASCPPTSNGPGRRSRSRTIPQHAERARAIARRTLARDLAPPKRGDGRLSQHRRRDASSEADPGTGGPLVIADGTDNPGGGGYGDATKCCGR
jgi:microcystin degradation protein MlrC